MPPARSTAFTASIGWDEMTSRPLRAATTLLAHLVVRQDFAVPEAWLR